MKRKILISVGAFITAIAAMLMVASPANAAAANFSYDYAFGSLVTPTVSGGRISATGSITNGYKVNYPIVWAEQQFRITQKWADGSWHDILNNYTIRSYNGQAVNQGGSLWCPNAGTHTYHAAWRHEFVPVNNDGSGGLHYHQGFDVQLPCGGFF